MTGVCLDKYNLVHNRKKIIVENIAWSERSLLVTPWAIDAFSEASVLAAEQASMAETTYIIWNEDFFFV